MFLQHELLQEGQHINGLKVVFHSLNDFGNGHPIRDFVSKPGVVLTTPHILAVRNPSNDLHSFLVSNQHGSASFGHLVLGSYPGHWFGNKGGSGSGIQWVIS